MENKATIPYQVPSGPRRRYAHVLGQAALVCRVKVVPNDVFQLDGHGVLRVLREAEAVLDKELLWRGIQTSNLTGNHRDHEIFSHSWGS